MRAGLDILVPILGKRLHEPDILKPAWVSWCRKVLVEEVRFEHWCVWSLVTRAVEQFVASIDAHAAPADAFE